MRASKLEGQSAVVMGEPKKRYRIIIQERLAKGNKIEKCRSFMFYDYTGRSTIDKLKSKLMARLIRFVK